LLGRLPASWSALTRLEEVVLDSNKLSGELPKEWASLIHLTLFSVANNELFGKSIKRLSFPY
jgi:hypothetical protein